MIILTGMHRSGTSYAASILQKSGKVLGKDLVNPAFDNPLGYFEDRDMVNFHNSVLRRRGMDLIVPKDVIKEFTAPERASAEEILARKGVDFVFKDPRATVVLEAWQNLCPIHVIFVVRDPIASVDSLIRRASDASVRRNFTNAAAGTIFYLRAASEFYKANPEKCRIYSLDDITRNESSFVRSVGEFCNIKLDEPSDAVFVSGMLKPPGPASWRARLASLIFWFSLRRHYKFLHSKKVLLS